MHLFSSFNRKFSFSRYSIRDAHGFDRVVRDIVFLSKLIPGAFLFLKTETRKQLLLYPPTQIPTPTIKVHGQ
jgi:hypothetical protein